MGLSDDQRALLRLLAQREEGYEDIAALLGLSVTEVRARVRGALGELDSAGADSGGPAAPPPSSSAAEPERRREPAREEPAPAAAAKRPAAEPRPLGRRLASLFGDRRRLFELGGAVLVVALIVLFATGAVNIGDGGDGSDSSAASAAAANRKITQAMLRPPNGGDAIGRAIFGRVGKGPVLQIVAEGLAPSGPSESYTVWLYRSPKLALRLGAAKVKENGGLAAQLPLPVELFAYLAGGAFDQIYISRTNDAAYEAEVARAKREKRLPAYTGTTVLRGEIAGPLVSG